MAVKTLGFLRPVPVLPGLSPGSTQIPASCWCAPWEAGGDGSSGWVFCGGDLDCIPGSLGRERGADDRSFCFCLSVKTAFFFF